MNEHERISELLPLAASGDITPGELRLLREHLSRCESCAGMHQDYSALTCALRGLPTPQPREAVVARVLELAESRLGRNPASGKEAFILVPLVVAGWLMAAATWPLARSAAVWMFTGWHVPQGGFSTALVFYSMLGFLLACVSAVAVGRRARTVGRRI